MSDLLTVRQAAQIVDVNENTVRKAAREAALPCVQKGRREAGRPQRPYLFDREEVIQWHQQCQENARINRESNLLEQFERARERLSKRVDYLDTRIAALRKQMGVDGAE